MSRLSHDQIQHGVSGLHDDKELQRDLGEVELRLKREATREAAHVKYTEKLDRLKAEFPVGSPVTIQGVAESTFFNAKRRKEAQPLIGTQTIVIGHHSPEVLIIRAKIGGGMMDLALDKNGILRDLIL